MFVKNIILGIAVSVIFNSCTVDSFSEKMNKEDMAIEKRVEKLLNRMTVEEKARQLDMYRGSQLTSNGVLDVEKAKKEVGNIGIGSIHDFYPANAKDANEVQRFIIENSRLGIPAIFIEEGLHGYQGLKATTFPVSIGIGSTWNPELAYEEGRVIGTEARSKNVHMLLAPTLGIGREPRWGRVEETYSEDTYLASKMASAVVKGLQGKNLADHNAVASDPKHFAAHSAPAGGRNTASVFVGEREIREFFLPVFESAIKKGGAQGIMAAYHELDGVPCSANKWLLTDVLRKEWGFKGFVLSDLGAINRLYNTFHIDKDVKSVIVKSLNAGMDMQFYDFPNDVFQNSIIEAVQQDEMDEKVLDRAVKDVLRVKFKLGLFDNPYVDETLADKVYHCKKHQDLAKQSGKESIILLKNEGNILPLSKDEIKSIAVLGDLSNLSLLGGYSPKSVKATTVLEGIKKKVGNNIKIKYSKGISVTKYLSSISADNVFVEKGKHGLKVEYYNNLELKGSPSLTRVEDDFVMDWYNLSPAPGIDDSFSARISCMLKPDMDGRYKIQVGTNNRVKYYLENKLVFDSWGENVKGNNDIILDLKSGEYYPFKIEFSKNQIFARLAVNWSLVEKSKATGNSALKEAVQNARTSDVVIVILGENSSECGEGKDKMNLDFDSSEKEFLHAIYNTGTPVVLVLMNGRPMTIPWAAENIPAIVETWFAGEFQGDAIADVLFGDFNPSGRLPISIPKHVGQVPIFYNHKPSFEHNYVDCDSKPLFPFGYGLSYTTFKYENLKLSKKQIRKDGIVTVSVDVTNTGNLAGAEVVQLYINDLESSIITPIIELKGFKKINLKPNETKTIKFTLGFDELSLWNGDMKQVVEPGQFSVMIGKSCENIILKDLFEVTE